MPDGNRPEVVAEVRSDLETFACSGLDADAHVWSVQSSPAIRKWMAREGLSAFTVSFWAIDRSSGLTLLPFVEASKATARGKGCAGEGDLLTAALVGTLATVFPENSFVETSCADWKSDRILMSHVGEINPRLVAGRAELVGRRSRTLKTDIPLVTVGRSRAGEAVFATKKNSRRTMGCRDRGFPPLRLAGTLTRRA